MRTKRLSCMVLALVLLAGGCSKKPAQSQEKDKPSLQTMLLCKAAEEGDIEKVRSLVSAGADIHALGKDGKTILHLAAERGQSDTVEFLISKGLDINTKNINGATPLALAVGGYRNKKTLPKAETSDGHIRRADYFYRQGQFDRVIEDYSLVIQDNPRDDDAYFNRGKAWAKEGNPQQAVADWKKAIELNWSNALKVFYARRLLKSPDAELDRLIRDTAAAHLKDLGLVSGSAIGYAASPGEFYTVSLIISRPFDEKKFIQMAQNNDPVLRAMAMICLARQDKAKYEKVIQSFYTDTAEVKYMPGGCMMSTITLDKLAKSIIDDPNVLDCWSAAHTDWKSRPSERDKEREEIVRGQIGVIQSLIAHGAGVNVKDLHGETPLHYAAGNRGKRVAEFLIANGADVNAKSSKGETPLHVATFWGDRKMIELLVAHGADLNAKNNEGQTALDVATQQDYPGLIALLREFGQKKQKL